LLSHAFSYTHRPHRRPSYNHQDWLPLAFISSGNLYPQVAARNCNLPTHSSVFSLSRAHLRDKESHRKPPKKKRNAVEKPLNLVGYTRPRAGPVAIYFCPSPFCNVRLVSATIKHFNSSLMPTPKTD